MGVVLLKATRVIKSVEKEENLVVPQIRLVTILGESQHEPVTRLGHSLLLLLWAELVFPNQLVRHISFKSMINTVSAVSQAILNTLFTQPITTVAQHQFCR